MKLELLKEVIELVHQFELENEHDNTQTMDVSGFKKWISTHEAYSALEEPDWEGKKNGRSADSIINTFFVHLNRYAKNYTKSAIHGSDFATQDDLIYLITLKSYGTMSKMELIKKNVHDKPAGIQIINRLIQLGWVAQTHSETDKRSKVLQITDQGHLALEAQMPKTRMASQIVTGNLSSAEKMELIRLLSKLNDFHHPIYSRNIETSALLEVAFNELKP